MTSLPLHSRAKLVIDCSTIFDVSSEAQSADIAGLIQWVKEYPQRSSIHVYVGGGRDRQASRKLQGRLQALGCTVIARHVASAR